MTGTLYVISAPSGAGKTSLVKALIDSMENLGVSISHTTRPIRPGETDGINYHFTPVDDFQAMLGRSDFLEHAEVFGNYYGTSKSWVEQQLLNDQDVILEIDWQGAQQIRQQIPEAIGIFVLPPSKEALEQRLRGRGQDPEGVIQNRLAQAAEEMAHHVEYNYLIINDDFEVALTELRSIIHSQRLSTKPQATRHKTLIQNLLS
ncbi:guanylate kinase [Gammaproteobacteria bacterium 45_16_T64]|nr:guanylate kinase [Gammaproteobacteria bacterium 45_16_T64]